MPQAPALQHSNLPQPIALQVDDAFQRGGLIKIDFKDETNMEAHLMREYSRLHLNLKGAHVFAERDQVWASMTPLASGELIYVIFHINHAEFAKLSARTTINRHDAIMSEMGEDGRDIPVLRTKNTTVMAWELNNMPDFFFRPRFKGRQASRSSLIGYFRPSIEGVGKLLGVLKSGLQ